MYLFIDHEKCRGCKACEIACSFHWSKIFSPAESTISIIKKESEGITFPIVCQQCERPICVSVCTTGAIKISEKTNHYFIDADRCIGCKTCITSCPFGGTIFAPSTKTARKCNLCDGEPECAKFCPYDAIELIKEEKIVERVRKKYVEKTLILSR